MYKKKKASILNCTSEGISPTRASQDIGSTKVQIFRDNAIICLKKLAVDYAGVRDIYGFLTNLRVALNLPKSAGASKYGVVTIPTKRGNSLEVSLSISNHHANAYTYITNNANFEYNFRLVIRKHRQENRFRPSPQVRLDEFAYYGYMFGTIEDPLSKIILGIIHFLITGRFVDYLGTAIINVSPDK